MKRSLLTLLVASLPLPVWAQTIYKCVDASGGTIIANSNVENNCKLLVSAPAVTPVLGMSKAKVFAVAGKPSRKIISKKPGLVRELWYYGASSAFVIENGVVVEILTTE